jgi:hypothetical protein
MPLEKPTAERLRARLQAFRSRFTVADMLLVLKDTFLDVVHIRKTDFIDGKPSTLFPTDDDVFEFAGIVIKCIESREPSSFSARFLENPDFKVGMVPPPGEGVCWWLNTGVIGDTFFSCPGAVLVGESAQYYVFTLVSKGTFGKITLDREIEGLVELAADLESPTC